MVTRDELLILFERSTQLARLTELNLPKPNTLSDAASSTSNAKVRFDSDLRRLFQLITVNGSHDFP